MQFVIKQFYARAGALARAIVTHTTCCFCYRKSVTWSVFMSRNTGSFQNTLVHQVGVFLLPPLWDACPRLTFPPPHKKCHVSLTVCRCRFIPRVNQRVLALRVLGVLPDNTVTPARTRTRIIRPLRLLHSNNQISTSKVF